MDYEKAYKESFEAAKGLHEAGNALTKKQMEIVFPQLVESEDERIRKRFIEYFQGFLEGNEDCYKDGGYVRWEGLDVKSILAWLEKQKEQKPAEWSEEDSEMMMRIINQVGGYTYFAGMDSERVVNWLKSIRPVSKESLQSWKPSEEQMKALLRVVDKARELHYSSNSGYDEYDVLRLLYKQLKEL